MSKFYTVEEEATIKQVVNRLAETQFATIDTLDIDDRGYIEVILTKIPFVDYNDDFSAIFPDLLEGNCLTVEKIEHYLYEKSLDWEWYGQHEPYFPIDTFRGDLQAAIPRLTDAQVEELVHEDICFCNIVMTNVAQRIYSDLEDWIHQGTFKVITLQDVKEHKTLRNLLAEVDPGQVNVYTDWKDSYLLNWITVRHRVDLAIRHRSSEFSRSLFLAAKHCYPYFEDNLENPDYLDAKLYDYLEQGDAKEFDELIIKDKDLLIELLECDDVIYLPSGGIVEIP